MEHFAEFTPSLHLFSCRERLRDNAQKEHIASYHDLIYVKKGEITYTVDSRTVRLAAGDFGYIPKGCLKKAMAIPDVALQYYTLIFLYDNQDVKIPALPIPLRVKGNSVSGAEQIMEQLKEVWAAKRPGYLLPSRALVMLLIHRLLEFAARRSSIPDDAMYKAKRHIESRFQQKIRVGELAALMKLNPVYFGNLFLKHTGFSVKEYVNRVRIDNAKSLLDQGIFNVGEVAELCGFQDVFYFSKVFKRLVGIPPSAYRKHNREHA